MTKWLEWVRGHKAALLVALGYLTAGVVLLTVFLYLTFPWEKLSDYVRLQTERMTAGTVHVQTSEIRFPLKLIWSGVVFSPQGMQRKDGGPVRMTLDRVAVEWPLGPLLKRRVELLWSAELAGGKARGLMAMQPTEHGVQYRLEGEIREIDLGRMIEWVATNEHEVEGRVSLNGVRHDWIGTEFLKGTGNADLSVTAARIGALDLNFAQITAQITMKAGAARLEGFSARGTEMDLTGGGGDVLFRSGVSDSLINLNSRATVKRATGILIALGSSAELSLRGTFGRPTLFVNGAPIFTGSVS